MLSKGHSLLASPSPVVCAACPCLRSPTSSSPSRLAFGAIGGISLSGGNHDAQRPRLQPLPGPPRIRRQPYATARTTAPHEEEDLPWPRLNGRHAVPTPYQIFGQAASDPYSKARYYELVKAYHPDRHGHRPPHPARASGLSPALRLERYRLIVAAHEILSDPVRRRAYDRDGAGWTGRGQGDEDGGGGAYGRRRRARDGAPPDDHGRGSDSIFYNATWEDWERWHQGRTGRRAPPRPVPVARGAGLSLIVVLVTLGAVVDAKRGAPPPPPQRHMTLRQQRERIHTDALDDLIRRRLEASAASGSRTQRALDLWRRPESLVDPADPRPPEPGGLRQEEEGARLDRGASRPSNDEPPRATTS
ncbi:MAG: hypothetical protein M1826_006396 [Phylliscum demangeonii]|nr:MAG: hypothetical protein M1826_006396 [Phylliscum demangeonii]